MNYKWLVAGILCNLEKEFDFVNHNKLLTKLKFYWISGNDYAFYESYQENWYERTALYNEKLACNNVSSWAKVLHVVPQGSVLRPLLILTYINDLPKIINDESMPILFAHDTSILVAYTDFIDFNNNIHNVVEILNKRFKVSLLLLILIRRNLHILRQWWIKQLM